MENGSIENRSAENGVSEISAAEIRLCEVRPAEIGFYVGIFSPLLARNFVEVEVRTLAASRR